MRDVVRSGPTFAGVALSVLSRWPERTAFTWDGGALTYAGATNLIGRMQAVLHARGLRRGQCVAILTTNRAESWCASIAAQASGLTITWLHPLASVVDHLHQLTDSGAAALVVDTRRFTERGGELSARMPALEAVFTIGAAEYGRDLLGEAQAGGPAAPVDLSSPDDLALIGYTGGTTGRPKGIERRNSALASIFPLTLLTDFEIPASPRFLAVAPISHVTGTKIIPAFMRGGSVHLLDGFSPDRVLSAIERERVNCTLLVPSMIYALLDDPAMRATDLSSLELLIYAGAPMAPTRLSEGLERIGPVFTQLYGQAECYHATVLKRADHDPARPELLASAGRPGATSVVAILDEDGNEVAAGESGEVCVRTPLAMDGYRNLPELTAETFRFGWLHTGDIGRKDEDDYLYILDRKKDMIIVSGTNVFARGVEDALMSHPSVMQAGVFGVPDSTKGEAVSAAVVLRPGATVDLAELAKHVRDRQGELQVPQYVHFVDKFPVTSIGKIDKVALRARFPR
ncbi:MAG TPA: AMP-binding protein [Trebonia sp.]